MIVQVIAKNFDRLSGLNLTMQPMDRKDILIYMRSKLNYTCINFVARLKTYIDLKYKINFAFEHVNYLARLIEDSNRQHIH